jgi:hypothetical protein
MKNFDFKINVLAMMVFCLWLVNIIGCKQATPDVLPASDPSRHVHYHTGIIEALHYYDCVHGIHADKYEPHIHGFQITFSDGVVIRTNRLFVAHAPKIGDKGSLYVITEKNIKKDDVWKMSTADFYWEKEGEENKKIVKVFDIPKEIIKAETPVVKENEWQEANNSSPDVYQLVLIKLDNKIITTGRFNESNEWQIETDKGRKSFNKYPSFKVVEWKEL